MREEYRYNKYGGLFKVPDSYNINRYMNDKIREKANVEVKKYSNSDYRLESLRQEAKRIDDEYYQKMREKYGEEYEQYAREKGETFFGDEYKFYLSKDKETSEEFSEKIKQINREILDLEKKWENFGKYDEGNYELEEKNYNNKGYSGEKMSVRAVTAYNEGKKPISQYTKYDLEQINEVLRNRNVYELKDVTELRNLLRRYSGGEWHHTGKNYNQTTFYSFNEVLEKFNSALEMDKAIMELRKWQERNK